MNTPHKVVIEVTGQGWNVTVTDKKGGIISKRQMEMVTRGHAKSTTSGDIFDDLPDEMMELAEAIDDHNPFDIAGAIMDLHT